MLVNKLTSGPNMPVQFYLFTRPDKQGDHPINVSISLFGERLCTSVGYAIAPDKWDDKTQRVKKNAYNSKKVAYNLINSRLNLIHGHFERLEAIEKKLTKDGSEQRRNLWMPATSPESTQHSSTVMPTGSDSSSSNSLASWNI